MATNTQDTLITIDKGVRDKLKALAEDEGRTMKGMLKIIIEDYKKGKK